MLSRRSLLGGVGAGLLGGVGASLVASGCGSDADEVLIPESATSTGGSASQSQNETASVPSTWAIGGTAAMLAASAYPDPFEDTGACALTCTLTQGPCWAPNAPLREDISEGEPGIPMRLALRVVEADGCTPVQGAEIEIWYCNVAGTYSASDVEGGSFCTGDDEHAVSGYFFRGRAITDADGKAAFHGCYPGWYSGRAVHIHLLVRPPEAVGEHSTSNAVAISQLFFPEALTAAIFASTEGYRERGQPDTSLAVDNVLSSVDDSAPFIVDYQQAADGSMLAWKTIALSSTDQCGSSGAGPGGAPPMRPG